MGGWPVAVLTRATFTEIKWMGWKNGRDGNFPNYGICVHNYICTKI